mmetsp:Transcript_534/g.1438  ORF Transcript_534/g.1438 Transcript_534/m.1438 type:complete len:213 (+) Transcript_534:523-1161(+)
MSGASSVRSMRTCSFICSESAKMCPLLVRKLRCVLTFLESCEIEFEDSLRSWWWPCVESADSLRLRQAGSIGASLIGWTTGMPGSSLPVVRSACAGPSSRSMPGRSLLVASATCRPKASTKPSCRLLRTSVLAMAASSATSRLVTACKSDSWAANCSAWPQWPTSSCSTVAHRSARTAADSGRRGVAGPSGAVACKGHELLPAIGTAAAMAG